MDFLEDRPLDGVRRVRLNKAADMRGGFVKTYAETLYAAAGLTCDLREEFYSISHKGVVRGMHFQVPPHDHNKFVYCAVGAVTDVLLDLRSGPGYGKFVSLELCADKPEMLFIPKGVAHGFKSRQDNTLIVYKTDAEYAPQHDRGVRWDSFGYDWGDGEPVMSDRDRAHPTLAEFVTPF